MYICTCYYIDRFVVLIYDTAVFVISIKQWINSKNTSHLGQSVLQVHVQCALFIFRDLRQFARIDLLLTIFVLSRICSKLQHTNCIPANAARIRISINQLNTIYFYFFDNDMNELLIFVLFIKFCIILACPQIIFFLFIA